MVNLEIIFYKDYNLLIYLKATIAISKAFVKAILLAIVEEIDNFSKFDSSDSNKELLDIEEIIRDF